MSTQLTLMDLPQVIIQVTLKHDNFVKFSYSLSITFPSILIYRGFVSILNWWVPKGYLNFILKIWFTVSCRINRLFGIFLYKMDILTIGKMLLKHCAKCTILSSIAYNNVETISMYFGSKIQSGSGVTIHQTLIFHFSIVKWTFFISEGL